VTGNGVHSGSESQPLALRLLINSPFHTSFPSLVSSPLVSSSSSVYPFTLCLSPILTLSRSISLSLSLSRALKDGGIPTFLRCYGNTAARTGKRGRREEEVEEVEEGRMETWWWWWWGDGGKKGEGGGVWKRPAMRGCVNNANANGSSGDDRASVGEFPSGRITLAADSHVTSTFE